MNTPNDVLIHSLTRSQMLLARYTADLSPQEYLHRPAEKANCTAWLIGHLTLSERRVMTMLGITDLPPLPPDFEKRFSRDEGCPQAGEFGDVAALMPLFNQHRAMLVEAINRATLDQLNKPTEKPHPMFSTLGELASFYALHTVMHAGQITIIRRSLGRPPIA